MLFSLFVRYPGQEGENRSRDTKIPSVLYYSQEGEVRAVGAEARLDATRLDAMDEDWILVEWYCFQTIEYDTAVDTPWVHF